MSSRETIDIEALLFRAYGEKRVHRLRDAKAGALGLIMPRGVGGGFGASEKVDTSSFSARVAGELREMQARLGAAPSGLLDLHDVVLSLENFYVEPLHGQWLLWDADTAEAMGHRIFDGKDGVSIAKVRPRTGGKPGEVVEIEARRRLTRIVTSTLLIQCGQYGDRPYVPELVVVRERPVYKGARKEAAGYVPEYETPPHVVVEAQASYAAWHTALTMLREIFKGSTEYEVTGPRAPAAPWQTSLRVLDGANPYALDECHPDDPAEEIAAKKPSRRSRNSPKKSLAAAA